MVRTVRSIEEEARVRRVAGVGLDRYLSRADFLDAVDGRVLRDLREWASEGVRRVLVVGLEDHGGVALSMAAAGLFVTVVDPDEAVVAAVRGKAEAEKCALRMNFYSSDYMQKEFTSSGFDLAVFLSALSRYNEPLVVVRKAARELRAGGRFFGRIRVRPPLPGPGAWLDRVPLGRAWRARARAAASRVALLERWMAIPDAGGFLAGLSDVLKVDRVERVHLAAPLLAAVGLDLPGEATRAATVRALKVLAEAEDRVLSRATPARFLASYLVVFATKELGLGKTFRR